MRKSFLSLLVSISYLIVCGQAGSQTIAGREPLPVLTEKWDIDSVAGFTAETDTVIRFSGHQSLRIMGDKNAGAGYLPFSQTVAIGIGYLTRIVVTARIKTKDLDGTAALLCRILDKNDKLIGFQNLEAQDIQVSGTDDWKKYSLRLTVNSDAKKLMLGGYLGGSGTAWFDDFSLEYISPSTIPASEDVTTFIHEFIALVKKNSIFTDSLNWPVIDADIHELSMGLKKVEEVSVLTDYVLQQLRKAGDNHSVILPKVVAEQYATKNSNLIQPQGRIILPDNIGYISVPGFGSTSDTAKRSFAARIQQMIRQIDTGNPVRGWIVDLRGNTGGNMWPMIAGLAPIVGTGTLGYFIKTIDGKEQKTAWNTLSVKVEDPYSLRYSDAKVAVLIGPRTGSSGEMTAIAFIGRKKTRLFGQLSGGYTTSNSMYKLSDGSNLVLASSYVADRTLKKYSGRITPDEIVQPVQGEDAEMKAARKWILEEEK